MVCVSRTNKTTIQQIDTSEQGKKVKTAPKRAMKQCTKLSPNIQNGQLRQ